MGTGSIGVFAIAADNNGTNGDTTNLPSSFSDSKSNTWTIRAAPMIYDNGVAGAGVELGIYTSVLTTPLVPGDTLSITYSIANVSAKSMVIWEFAPQSGGTMSYVTGGAGTGATTASPTVTTGSIASGDYVIGVCGLEATYSFTRDSDTSNGSWSNFVGISCSSGTGGMSLISQYKQVSATATQTFNPTNTSGDTMIGWIQINESAAAGGSSAAFFALF